MKKEMKCGILLFAVVLAITAAIFGGYYLWQEYKREQLRLEWISSWRVTLDDGELYAWDSEKEKGAHRRDTSVYEEMIGDGFGAGGAKKGERTNPPEWAASIWSPQVVVTLGVKKISLTLHDSCNEENNGAHSFDFAFNEELVKMSAHILEDKGVRRPLVRHPLPPSPDFGYIGNNNNSARVDFSIFSDFPYSRRWLIVDLSGYNHKATARWWIRGDYLKKFASHCRYLRGKRANIKAARDKYDRFGGVAE